jgi:hypothetical protein
VPGTPASPLPNPTPSTKATLSEVEVEKSIKMGMTTLEQLPWFGLDPTLKGVLPQESAAPPPSVTEVLGSTAGASVDARA